MARLTPLWMQAGEYSAEVDRQLIGALSPSGGVVTGMELTAVNSTRNVMITAGKVVVPLADGGAYLCVSTAGEELPIPLAPPSGQSRRDLIIVRPREGTNDWIFDVVSGTPAAPASATTPATPAATVALGHVTAIGAQAFVNPGDLSYDSRNRGLGAGSQLAYAERTAGQTGIQSAIVDLTGLNTGVFRVAGRRRIEVFANVVFTKAASDVAQWMLMQIAEQGNQSVCSAYEFVPAPGWCTTVLSRWMTVGPGDYQYKCRAQTAAGSLNVMAAVNSLIAIRDLGPA